MLGNLHALSDSLDHVKEGDSVSLGMISDLNRTLLAGTRLEPVAGKVRTEQNWIGGNRVNPVGAAYVPPQPSDVPPLLNDLVAFLETSVLHAVAKAAIAHAQFETIHPFADGNGRVGRALVHVILKASGFSQFSVPPVSLILATDRERYIANLAAYRVEGTDGRAGAMCEWIEYFANVLTLSCERAEAGVLRQNFKARKSGIYVADEVLAAFNSYERALATLSGDTAHERPHRLVPQRR